MTETDHEWRPVVGFEGIYEVRHGADGGAVRRVVHTQRSRVGRQLKSVDGAGYFRCTLSHPEHGVRCKRIHVLILEAFVGECPPGFVGCHKDDDKMNNSLSNLYWGTRSQNNKDAYKNGKRKSVKGLGNAAWHRAYIPKKTHCKRGHSLDDAYRVAGRRVCRHCQSLRKKSYIRK